jgi:MFS family permease
MERPVLTLIFAVLLLEIGSGLQGILVPLRADLAGFPMPLIGALGTSYYIGFVAGCLVLPATIRRVGHIRSFAAFAAIAAPVILAHTMTSQPAVWLGLRFAFGICFAGLFMVIESWLNERATTATRGSVLGLYMVATWAGLIAGKMLLVGVAVDSFQAFALCTMVISLALVPVALTDGAAPAIPRPGRLAPRALLGAAPVALVGALAVGIANGAFWTLGPLFAEAETGSPAGASLFMSACALGGALSQWPLGRLSDRFDRRWMLFATSLAAATMGATLVLSQDVSFWGFMLLAGLFGAGALPVYSLCLAHANDRVESGEFVEVSSLILLTFGLGAIVGPLLAGLIVEASMPSGLFVLTAAIHLSLAVIILIRLATARGADEADRVTFAPQAPISHGTQVVIDLMPSPDVTPTEEAAPGP